MTDIAELGYHVDSSGLTDAEKKLDDMTQASARAEKGANKLGDEFKKLTERLFPATKRKEDLVRLQELVNAKYSAGEITAEQYANAVSRIESETKKVNDALSTTQTSASRMEKLWKSLTRSLGAYLSVKALVTAAFTAIAVQTTRYINQLSMMSQQIGVSTEALSGLRYAAEQMAGVSEGRFDMALRRMTRRIAEAAEGGGQAAEALKRMGVDAGELSRRRPDEQLRRIADAMKSTDDQATRLRNTMAIFDTEGMPLVNMLSQGAAGIREFEEEAERLGITIDTKTTKAAELLTREMTKLNGAKQGLKNRITADLLPSLTALVRMFTESADGADRLDYVSRAASSGLKALGWVAAGIVGIFKTVGEALGGIAAAVVNLFTGNFREAWNITKDFSTDIVGNLEQTWSNMKSVWDGVEIDDTPLTDAVTTDLNETRAILDVSGGKVIDQAQKVYEQVEQAIARIKRDVATFGMSDEAVILFDLEADGALPEQLRRAEAALNRRMQLQEEKALTDELAQAEESRWQSFGRMIGAIKDEQQLVRMSARDQEIWNNLKWAGVDASSTMGQAIIRETKALQRMSKEMETTIAAMDGVRDSGRDLFKDLARGGNPLEAVESALERIYDRMLDIISERLIEQMFGQTGSAGGGWFASAVGSLFGGNRRNGGGVRDDQFYRVGEGDNPELLSLGSGAQYLIPGDNGRVTPISAPASGGSMATPQININVSGNANVESATARQNSSGGFDVDLIMKQVDGYIAGGVANGSSKTLAALKGRLDVRERV